MGMGDAGYDTQTSEKEVAKEKSGWIVVISSIVGFILLGAIIWGANIGSNY